VKVSELKRGDVFWLTPTLKKVILGPAFPAQIIHDSKYVMSFGVATIAYRLRWKKIDWRDEEQGNTSAYGLQCGNSILTDDVSPMLTVERDGVILQEGTG